MCKIRLLTDNEKNLINGTSYIGSIETSINELINKIGKPQIINHNINDDTHFEWQGAIEHNGKIIPFALYDYKNKKILEDNEMYDFHIGAFSENAHIVKQVLADKIFK